MHVGQVWRYPVKSMVGEPVPVADLDEHGIVGDRTWATRDLTRGGIRGAKQLGGLMRCAARVDGDDRVVITLPDGTVTDTSAPDVHERVSAAIGHPVVLEALRPADDLDHYRRGAPVHDDVLTELRSIFGRDPDEPLPDFSVFPPEVAEFESPPGSYHDCYPLMVLTTAALAAMQAALPDSVVDVRRFRPSLVIDTETHTDTGTECGHGHLEFEWEGRTATIGTAVVEFLAPCPRCVMITREIDAATPADRQVLRHVVRELDQNVGVYARVVEPGRVAVGDAVTFR